MRLLPIFFLLFLIAPSLAAVSTQTTIHATLDGNITNTTTPTTIPTTYYYHSSGGSGGGGGSYTASTTTTNTTTVPTTVNTTAPTPTPTTTKTPTPATTVTPQTTTTTPVTPIQESPDEGWGSMWIVFLVGGIIVAVVMAVLIWRYM